MVPIYKIIAAAVTAITLGATASCQSTTSGGAVGADRQQLLLVSSAELDRMAAQAYNKLQAESSKKGTAGAEPHENAGENGRTRTTARVGTVPV